MQGDDIIFPNLDMCLTTLAGWFNESLLKKNYLSLQYSPDGFPQPDSDDDFADVSISVHHLLFDIAAENSKAHNN